MPQPGAKNAYGEVWDGQQWNDPAETFAKAQRYDQPLAADPKDFTPPPAPTEQKPTSVFGRFLAGAGLPTRAADYWEGPAYVATHNPIETAKLLGGAAWEGIKADPTSLVPGVASAKRGWEDIKQGDIAGASGAAVRAALEVLPWTKKYVPDVVAGTGRATSAVGRGLEAVGESGVMRHAGTWGAGGAMAHGNLPTAAVLGLAGPTTRAIGRGVQRLGGAMTEAGESGAISALRGRTGQPSIPVSRAGVVQGSEMYNMPRAARTVERGAGGGYVQPEPAVEPPPDPGVVQGANMYDMERGNITVDRPPRGGGPYVAPPEPTPNPDIVQGPDIYRMPRAESVVERGRPFVGAQYEPPPEPIAVQGAEMYGMPRAESVVERVPKGGPPTIAPGEVPFPERNPWGIVQGPEMYGMPRAASVVERVPAGGGAYIVPEAAEAAAEGVEPAESVANLERRLPGRAAKKAATKVVAPAAEAPAVAEAPVAATPAAEPAAAPPPAAAPSPAAAPPTGSVGTLKARTSRGQFAKKAAAPEGAPSPIAPAGTAMQAEYPGMPTGETPPAPAEEAVDPTEELARRLGLEPEAGMPRRGPVKGKGGRFEKRQ